MIDLSPQEAETIGRMAGERGVMGITLWRDYEADGTGSLLRVEVKHAASGHPDDLTDYVVSYWVGPDGGTIRRRDM